MSDEQLAAAFALLAPKPSAAKGRPAAQQAGPAAAEGASHHVIMIAHTLC